MHFSLRLSVLLLALSAGISSVGTKRFTQSPSNADGLVGSIQYSHKRVANADLRLYVFKPLDLKATDKRSAILLFAGGGWRTLNPAAMARRARDFAAKGLISVV